MNETELVKRCGKGDNLARNIVKLGGTTIKGNDNRVYITLSQAGKTKGCFHAIETEDKKTQNAIIYARTNFNSASGAIEIYVSDFDNTYYTKAKTVY